ncbi:MAG: peptidylprolyl isomerase [Candidatus Omnitrophica bacterium]|nr:peptidylprolyl isomerase [Candidatus Omnitrophota bacterium]MBI3020664.1 peptidylprolyl isomerase [Candidatus Omnitrophota bacterium]
MVGWLLFTVHCSLFTVSEARAETVNRILAIVNEDVITEADVASQAQALLDDEEGGTPSETLSPEMRHAALRRLIEQRLILQEAKRSGISVSGDQVLEHLKEIRGRFESEEAFRASLAESGLSEEQLKENLRDQLMTRQLIDREVRAAVKVSPQEVARAVAEHPELAKSGDRVRASHILIRVSPNASEEKARDLVEDLHRQLSAGADFSTLAKRYSEDPHREEGGAMGWVAQGELLPELDAALFSLKAGELSLPIQTRLGFHLLKVEERRNASSLTVLEANRAVYQQLYQQKFQQAFTRWLGALMRRAYIEIVDPS